jgi:glycosyltransferase involved in cell wall biosynthesis
MKILYYSSHPTLSLHAQTGPGTHMREMISAMRHLGHEVHPVIMADYIKTKPGIKKEKSFSLKSAIKKFIPGIVWRSLKEYQLLQFDRKAEGILKTEIDSFKPDLVYERAAYLQESGLNNMKMRSCPHYMEINAPFMDEVAQFEKAPTLWHRKARHVESLQARHPDKVYVVSTVLKKYYMQYGGDEDRIEVIPNCVNTLKAKCNMKLKRSLLEKFGLRGKKVIGFVGSIFPYHGIDVLIRAFANIAASDTVTVLLIVGDGETLPELRTLCRRLGIDDRVIFTGSVPNQNVFSYIDLMDIAVMAKSNWYGSPVKIFEYGAMKKPIIAPLTPPVMDVMREGIDGWLTQPDEISVSKAILGLLGNKELSLRMAGSFHNKVMNKHTWQRAAAAILGTPDVALGN